MSAAAEATGYVRKLVGREMQGPNDLGESMNRLEQTCGISYWTLEYFRKGKAKTCDGGLLHRIRGAYLDHCERQLKNLQHELRIEKAKGHDSDADLVAEIETLLEKVAARRG